MPPPERASSEPHDPLILTSSLTQIAPYAVGVPHGGKVRPKGEIGFMRVPIRQLVLVLVIAALILPASVSAQPAPFKTISTQDLVQAKNGGNDWITYGGALNNQRYSTLDQINVSNVAQLKGAWMTRL